MKKNAAALGIMVWLLAVISVLPGCLVRDYFSGQEIPEEPPPVQAVEPAPEKKALPPPEVVLTPARPVRGDHVLIEIGPFAREPDVKAETGTRGAVSLPFWFRDRVYMLAAVSYFNEPGEYQLAFEISDAEAGFWEKHVTLEVVEGDFTHQRFSVPAERTSGWTSKQLEADREKARQARELTVPRPLWQGSFQWPLEGRVSSDYGAMRTINNQAPTRHNGIDIAAREGTPLAAANRGVVRLAEHHMASGNIVIIDHGMDICSTYLHLHEIWVEEGQWVEKGEVIGTVGQTGFATGPHLHWSVYVGHTPVSPYRFMEEGFCPFNLVWDPVLGPR